MKFLVTVFVVSLIAVGLAQAQEDVAETAAKTVIDTAPIVEAPITEADREHWAFRPVKRPELPAVKDRAWPRNGADAFVLARLEEEGLAPAPEANRATLLRRLSFDLVGLPPTPEQLAAFEADRAPDAYERVADRLLATPAYGERWGQHWLDLARFAETDGFEHDKVRPQAWKYRDWVIAALNADMPYDEFVRMQIAGESSSKFQVSGFKLGSWNLEPETWNSSLPTAFCLSGPDMPDINDQLERRHNLLNELTATVGSVLLGLQMGCAQCHNHKYDPVSQADFYRLRAVFESAVPPLKRDAPYNVLAEQKDAPAARFWIRGDHRRPGVEVEPAFPRIAGATAGSSSSANPPSTAGQASSGTPRSAFADWLFADDNPLTARVIVNRLWQHHFGRGIFDTPSDVGLINAGPTHPELLDWLAVEMRDRGWGMKRMQRLIVGSAAYRQASSAECGMRNAELKAGESATPHSALRTPHSDSLFSQFPRVRLDGEALRDAMLAAAELLSGEWGGPGVMPPLPPELVGTLLKDQWKASPREADHYRRSIYVFARRNLRYPIFEAFDRPDANASCPVRNRSTTAPQSLVLFNSEFSLLVARHLAGRVVGSQEPGTRSQEPGTRSQEPGATAQEPARQIEQLYLLTLSRRPTEKESLALLKFLTDQRQRLVGQARPREELALPVGCPNTADPYAAAALVDACLALLNASEFLYVD
ncbi:MAG: DUF1549 and DUF1553 domain-containing protein [Planctomycetaceae bacterium]|nr:DUF1549 and DUF1553 domain-containing protein [Planctomycetaceae bacterium]